jgi:hypothetical protein
MNAKNEVIDFMLQHTPHIARTTAPLFGGSPGEQDHFASCVLLKIADTSFIITAAHVIDDIVHKNMLVYLPSASLEEMPISLEQIDSLTSPLNQSRDRQDDPYDVAIIKLKPEVAERLATHMRFVTLDGVEPHYLRLPPADFAIVGYPCQLSDRNEEDKTIVSTVMPYFTSLYDDDGARVMFDPQIHILMSFRSTYTFKDVEYGLDLPSPKGMSGCGMWRVKDEAEPLESLDWRNMRLIGIAHTWNLNLLKGTKIKYILQMIYTMMPEMRSEIDKHFPYPSLK